MSFVETLVAIGIILILCCILMPIIAKALYDIDQYITLLQANHTSKTLQFTDLSKQEWDMINDELGLNKPAR